MNKSELIDAAAASTGLSKSDVTKTLDSILGNISDAVQKGDRVALSGFGTFERRERSARTGRNPQTGETLQVAASKAPAFKPAKAFRDAVNT
jgi:DNA-binding protein HU-beta